ncbi:hypothetical protein H0H92_001533 [Tricholoma furcatifolium]|nr:hypothetical protein H0H92_001533 [Tricholoma furcatifolium]
MVKGYSGTAHQQGFYFQTDQQYAAEASDNGIDATPHDSPRPSTKDPSPPRERDHYYGRRTSPDSPRARPRTSLDSGRQVITDHRDTYFSRARSPYDSPRDLSPSPQEHYYRPGPSPPSREHYYKPISFGRGTQHLLHQEMSAESHVRSTPYLRPGDAGYDELTSDRTSDVSDGSKVEELIVRLESLFANKNEYRQLMSCRGTAAQGILDMFQRILDVAWDTTPRFQRHLIAAAQRLATKSGLYPTCHELHDVTSSDIAECAGGFADIYRGNFHGRVVCLKTIRLHRITDTEPFLKIVAKEAILWGQLRHPNVLPFYGIYYFKNWLSFVSPWMENGDLTVYLEKHHDSDRVAFDVAQGLQFLHQNKIIHGDLKGRNTLVNEHGRACIGDFGISSLADQEILSMTSSSSLASPGGSVRWQAPELFDPEPDDEVRSTEASDIYAWSCVAYEIFAGHLPFAHLTREAVIINKVTNGERPVRPPDSSPSWTVWGLTESTWALMQTCWNPDPVRRPTVGMVIEHLESLLPSGVDVDAKDNSIPPHQFREMTRPVPASRVGHELSVDAFESMLAIDGGHN